MSVAWYAAPDVNITVKVVKQEFLGYEKKWLQETKTNGGGGGRQEVEDTDTVNLGSRWMCNFLTAQKKLIAVWTRGLQPSLGMPAAFQLGHMNVPAESARLWHSVWEMT